MDRPKLITDESGRKEYESTEKTKDSRDMDIGRNLVHVGGESSRREHYRIVHDYWGTPAQAYDRYDAERVRRDEEMLWRP